MRLSTSFWEAVETVTCGHVKAGSAQEAEKAQGWGVQGSHRAPWGKARWDLKFQRIDSGGDKGAKGAAWGLPWGSGGHSGAGRTQRRERNPLPGDPRTMRRYFRHRAAITREPSMLYAETLGASRGGGWCLGCP